MQQHIMTLANSIIGVSVLAMPFCFKQCGIILATLILLVSAVLTRVVCHMLLKAGVMTRRRSYELLAFHTFGTTGKFLVEMSIIGFLIGTCVAFFVVIGDLGPAILAKSLQIENTPGLRKMVLMALAFFVALPLGMLRNVDSLSSVSALSIGFYTCLVVKVIQEAGTHLLHGDWLDKVHLWRPAGILQCIPIFAMALSCQTQLFEIYEVLPDPSLKKMNEVVTGAVNICTGVYLSVGCFGYIAFCTVDFGGNILMSFSSSIVTDLIKMGFVLSVAVSFPLVIFPMRASIYSLLYKRVQGHPEISSNYIPETPFKLITISVICLTLLVGIYIPNIELVLGLVGSTIGTIICIIFPAIMFIRATSKETFERLLAQSVFFLGILILFLSTYANLYAADQASTVDVKVPMKKVSESPVVIEREPKDTYSDMDMKIALDSVAQKDVVHLPVAKTVNTDNEPKEEIINKQIPIEDKRQEPPIPMEPKEPPKEPIIVEKVQVINQIPKIEEHVNIIEDTRKKIELPVNNEIDSNAINKEEHEIDTDRKEKNEEKEETVERKQEEILKKLEEHQIAQKQILEQQVQILEQLKDHKQDHDLEKELKNAPNPPVVVSEEKEDTPQLKRNIDRVPNVISLLTNQTRSVPKVPDVVADSKQFVNKTRQVQDSILQANNVSSQLPSNIRSLPVNIPPIPLRKFEQKKQENINNNRAQLLNLPVENQVRETREKRDIEETDIKECDKKDTEPELSIPVNIELPDKKLIEPVKGNNEIVSEFR